MGVLLKDAGMGHRVLHMTYGLMCFGVLLSMLLLFSMLLLLSMLLLVSMLGMLIVLVLGKKCIQRPARHHRHVVFDMSQVAALFSPRLV